MFQITTLTYFNSNLYKAVQKRQCLCKAYIIVHKSKQILCITNENNILEKNKLILLYID